MTDGCWHCCGRWWTDVATGRAPRGMRAVVAVLAIAGSTTRLAAQAAVEVTAGMTASGALVTDGVLLTELTPTAAPTLGITIALPTGGGPYRILLEGHYSSATLRTTATDLGTTDDIGSLVTLDALLLGEGPITGALRWQAGGGAIFYRPGSHGGVFLDGPVRRWMVAGGITWTRALQPHLSLLVCARVDYHTFTTDILLARGYAGTQGVRRVGLSAGLERTF